LLFYKIVHAYLKSGLRDRVKLHRIINVMCDCLESSNGKKKNVM
jgi:hypothetical protein